MYVVLSWFGWSTIRTQLFMVYHVVCGKIGVLWHKNSVSREVVSTSFIHPWLLPSREIIKEHFFMHRCLHLPFPICKIDSGKSLSPCIFMNTVCGSLYWCFKTPIHTHPSPCGCLNWSWLRSLYSFQQGISLILRCDGGIDFKECIELNYLKIECVSIAT